VRQIKFYRTNNGDFLQLMAFDKPIHPRFAKNFVT